MISPTDNAQTPWQSLARRALAGGALLALMLVIARTPLFSSLIAPSAFERALVLHVTLISVVWLAAMSAGLWGAGKRPARLASVGAALMFVAAVGGLGTPMLADYLPYLDHWIYLVAAGLFAAGIVAAALSAPCSLETPWQAALSFMRLPLLMAPLELLVRLSAGSDVPHALWGAGHHLQIAWTVLLLGLWSRQASRPGTGTLLIGTTALLSLVAPALALFGTADIDAMHSILMRSGLGSSVCVALMVFQPWRGPAVMRWATLLVTLGLAIGGLIDGQSTTIPAHYHGTVGAVSLSLLLLALPRAGRAVHAHAAGLLLMMGGMLIAGLDGLARKQALAASISDGLSLIGSSLIGVGGAIAALAVLAAIGSCRPAGCLLSRRLRAT